VPIARAAAAAGTCHRRGAAGHDACDRGLRLCRPGDREDGWRRAKADPLRPFSAEREDRDLRDNFADRLAHQRAADLLDLCAARKPDIIVCDEVDFGAMIAAERLAISFASVVVIAAGSFVRPALVGEPLHRLRAEHGLPPDPELAS